MLIQEGEPSPSDSGVYLDKEIPIITYWLDICENHHPECSSKQSKVLPTRLVDVGGFESQEPRLVMPLSLDFTVCQSNAAARRYLALSHCWGSAMPPTATTTMATISERIQKIPMSDLPRTFADFINIARRMHVQYAWIDSLCIIQDSELDWQSEAAQMASIYSNAYCTIAASSSADGTGGCHVDPDSEPYGPVILPISDTDENGRTTIRKARVFSSTGKPIVNILQQDPLNGRGWAFQERELSNRVMHFSQDSIRWECRTLKASLQFPWQDTNAFNGNLRIFDTGQISPSSADQQLNDGKQKEKHQEAWFEAVHKYTGRALTKQSDVLPAFSGIARTVQSRTGDRYLAGLWRSNLIRCLCWSSGWHPAGKSPIFNPDDPAPINHVRPSEYLAPSWSWASIKGQVRYEWWIFHALDPDPATPRAERFIPRILDATTIPAGLDEYGQLREGCFIRLVGKMKPAFTRGEGFKRQDREGLYDVHEAQIREVGMIKYDIPSDAPLGMVKAVFCLCVLPRAERHGDSVGLALVPTGRLDEFRRVGLVSAVQLAWYESAVECRISIV